MNKKLESFLAALAAFAGFFIFVVFFCRVLSEV
jgi:hypothetical protein